MTAADVHCYDGARHLVLTPWHERILEALQATGSLPDAIRATKAGFARVRAWMKLAAAGAEPHVTFRRRVVELLGGEPCRWCFGAVETSGALCDACRERYAEERREQDARLAAARAEDAADVAARVARHEPPERLSDEQALEAARTGRCGSCGWPSLYRYASYASYATDGLCDECEAVVVETRRLPDAARVALIVRRRRVAAGV